MDSLVTYLVSAMMAWVPLRAQAPFESLEDAQARYESIARDVASVAFDENETPIFDGLDGRSRTALLMLSIASFESSYKKTVDDGIGRGDHGQSVCLMQVHLWKPATREGWNARQLIEDRTRCFRSALHILHASFTMCQRLPVADRVSAYATGHCLPSAWISRSRVGRARSWWETHAPPSALAVDS